MENNANYYVQTAADALHMVIQLAILIADAPKDTDVETFQAGALALLNYAYDAKKALQGTPPCEAAQTA